MQTQITGKHIDITEGIRGHVEDKVNKFPRFYNSLTAVEVIIDGSEGGRQFVEIIARAEHNNVFVAKETGHDMYACIDVASHKIERQLTKHKEKERNNKHTGGGLGETSVQQQNQQ